MISITKIREVFNMNQDPNTLIIDRAKELYNDGELVKFFGKIWTTPQFKNKYEDNPAFKFPFSAIPGVMNLTTDIKVVVKIDEEKNELSYKISHLFDSEYIVNESTIHFTTKNINDFEFWLIKIETYDEPITILTVPLI